MNRKPVFFTHLFLLCLLVSSAAAFTIPFPPIPSVDLSVAQPPLSLSGGFDGGRLGEAIVMGDFNGDGELDMAVSEPTRDYQVDLTTREVCGVVHIIYGPDLEGMRSVEAASPQTRIIGADDGNRIGIALAAGDFNDDNIDDLAIGAPDRGSGGLDNTVYILWGDANLIKEPEVDLDNPSFSTLEIVGPLSDIDGPVTQELGHALAVGDWDDDGIDDLAIGAPFWTNGQSTEELGRVYLLYGIDTLPNTSPLNIMASGIFGDRAIIQGYFPSFAAPPRTGDALAMGDFDGDGIDDLAIGRPGHFIDDFPVVSDMGRVHIIYGISIKDPRPTSTVFLSSTPPTSQSFPAETVIGPSTTYAPGGRLGSSLGMGYYDNDRVADLIIGAPGNGQDDNVNGTVFVVRGQGGLRVRPASINLNDGGPIGVDFGVFQGNSGLDELGAAVALIDVNGDGRDDAVMSAPGDNGTGDTGRFRSGVVYAHQSRVLVPFLSSPFTVQPSFITHTYFGRQQNDQLGRTIARGDFNRDGRDDLLIGTPDQPSDQDIGDVVGIGADGTGVPRLVSATVVEIEEIDRVIDPGDLILLTFSEAVTVEDTLFTQADWFLSNTGAMLGSEATLSGATNDSNVLVLTLGSDFQNLVVSGENSFIHTQIDLSGLTNLLITSPITGQRAVDNGVSFFDDEGVDLRWLYEDIDPPGGSIGVTGGVISVEQNVAGGPINYEFTRHRLHVPAFALPGRTNLEFRGLPADIAGGGWPTAVRVWSDAANPEDLFDTPAQLTVQYRPEDIDETAGQIEGLVRLFRLTSLGLSPLGAEPGRYIERNGHVYEQMGTENEPNPEDNTVTVDIDGVGTFATIPVNPVDERSIYLRDTGGRGAARVTFQTDPALSPEGTSGYAQHEIEFPGYIETTDSDPVRIEIKIRMATIFDRTSGAPAIGANMFPNQSGAVFVIESRDHNDSVISFTDSVNITTQFFDREDPRLTDVIGFDESLGVVGQMRICSSEVGVGATIDYQFISDAQSVNPVDGLVSAVGVTPLTDANGQGAWGAVWDPTAVLPTVTLQDILDHILGVSVMDPNSMEFSIANGDSGDGSTVIDAADVVLFINP